MGYTKLKVDYDAKVKAAKEALAAWTTASAGASSSASASSTTTSSSSDSSSTTKKCVCPNTTASGAISIGASVAISAVAVASTLW